jgi:putative acetyltransferase
MTPLESNPVASVRAASSGSDIEAFRALCAEYGASLQYTQECKSLEHQGFSQEQANLPGAYAPPGGAMLIAWEGDEPIGCVALRPFSGGMCEMKRMYLRPAWRGRGIGRLLAEGILGEGRRLGYTSMRLDTGATMIAAAALYASLGFREIPRYNADPVPGKWMEIQL